MKTLKKISLLVAFFITATAFSFAEPSTDTSNKLMLPLQNMIERQMYSPTFVIDGKQDQFVRVSFTVNDDGSIKVNTTNSSNATLDKAVRERIEAILISDAKNFAGKEFSMVLQFKNKG